MIAYAIGGITALSVGMFFFPVEAEVLSVIAIFSSLFYLFLFESKDDSK